MNDIRSRRCVFISHCIMAQCVRANGIVKYFPGPIKPVMQFCLDNDINVMQMPCPEFRCSAGGLGREPHGKKWYETNGLRDVARKVAEEQVAYMVELTRGGYEILAILGMEFSPACAVEFLNRGPVIYRDKGIYVEELAELMGKSSLKVPFIGVNQRAHKKLERQLNAMLTPQLPGVDANRSGTPATDQKERVRR